MSKPKNTKSLSTSQTAEQDADAGKKNTHISPYELDVLARNRSLFVKEFETRPHIVSIGAKKSVFYENTWDSLPVKTRGLFVDRISGAIVARGYEKFFNLGERPESQEAALMDSLVFPVFADVKENGFIGIVGYDTRTDSIMAASKSIISPEGDFARMAAEIFLDNLDEGGGVFGKLDYLKELLRDTKTCVTMEVISPKKDPHIIKYEREHVVLLDILRLSKEFRPLENSAVVELGLSLGLDVKKRAVTLNDRAELADFIKQCAASTGRIEGYVLRDSVNAQFKIKLPYYAAWKVLRSRVAKIPQTLPCHMDLLYKNTRNALSKCGAGAFAEEAEDFLRWATNKPAESLSELPIVALRDEFHAERPAPDIYSDGATKP